MLDINLSMYQITDMLETYLRNEYGVEVAVADWPTVEIDPSKKCRVEKKVGPRGDTTNLKMFLFTGDCSLNFTVEPLGEGELCPTCKEEEEEASKNLTEH